MDDYTWQRLIEKRRSSHRWQGRLLLLLAVIIGVSVWYFAIYTRTPEYALKHAQQAIADQDEAALQRYVNLELLTSRAYDDLTRDLFAYDATLTPATKVMFEKYYLLIKPQLTRGTEQTILRRVRDGSWSLPGGTDILKGRQLGIDYDRFLERSQLRNTTLVDIGSITRSGTTATAILNVKEDYTGTPFQLEAAMEQAEDGHWQIAYIKNYHDYLDTISQIMNGDISEYIDNTAGIVDDYNATFEQLQQEFKRRVKTSDGKMSDSQRQALARWIENEIIPPLKKRQQKLDEIDVPAGARYLASQRQSATDLTIRAWQHYIKALRDDSPEEYDKAETLHKQELAVDLRVEDIIHHTAVSKNIPNVN